MRRHVDSSARKFAVFGNHRTGETSGAVGIANFKFAICSSFPRVCRLALLLLVMDGNVAAPRASADEGLARYYAGLRERGLHRLAESDCLRRLADERIADGSRAELSIELSRTYAEHAALRTGEEGEELWDRASHVLDVLLEAGAEGAYRELLLAQRAFVDAQRGAQLRWQAELFPLDEPAKAHAAEILRAALSRLEPLPAALDAQLRAALDQPPGDRGRPAAPEPSRYRDLRRTVEFRIAAATVDLAKVLPTGADRAAALDQADAALRELAKTPKPDQAAWLSEVLLIEVQRLKGDIDRVGSLVTALEGRNPPTEVRDAAAAQAVRAALDAGRPDAALERLQSHRGENGTASDELTELVVETLLSARRVAFDKQQPELAKDLMAEAESCATNLTGAWGDRSRVLIDAAREADTYGPQLAESVRRAKWAWRNGNLEEAISRYHDAVAEAHRSRQTEFAVEFAIAMATLQTEVRRYDGAVITLTGLLDNYPDSPRAADAHLLRAYALGRQYEQRPDDERRKDYREALEEHRLKFVDSPTVAEATWMLARLEEYEQYWSEAVALLESIPPDSARNADAQARLAAVYEHALSDLKRRGQPTGEWELRAIAALTAAVSTFPPAAAPLSAPQTETAWRLARLLLGQPQPDFAAADTLLERVLESDAAADASEPDASAAFDQTPTARLAAASQLRIVSLAGQGRLDEAREVVRQLERRSPDRLLDVLGGLTTAAGQVGLEHKQTVGTLQLEVSQSLDSRRETLSEEQRLKLDESLALAYAALGRMPQAAAVYEKLLWQQPGNARIIESLARLYESNGTISDVRNASKQWQALERLQRQGSPAWLESRYHLAWCSHRLGDDGAARKLIGVTRVLYPELGGVQLKEQFDKLEALLAADRRSPGRGQK
ncbi:MAG: hypothetical protein AB7Q45_18210 [Planctomycetaceae bacterium]